MSTIHFLWHIHHFDLSCPCGNCTSKTSEAFLSGRATSKVTTFTSPSAKAAWHSSPLRKSKVAVDATCTAQGMAGTTWYCAASPRSRDVQMWWKTSVWSCLRKLGHNIFGYIRWNLGKSTKRFRNIKVKPEISPFSVKWDVLTVSSWLIQVFSLSTCPWRIDSWQIQFGTVVGRFPRHPVVVFSDNDWDGTHRLWNA